MHMPHGMYGGGGEGGKKESEGSPDDAEKTVNGRLHVSNKTCVKSALNAEFSGTLNESLNLLFLRTFEVNFFLQNKHIFHFQISQFKYII
jgi:hypothetical protein